MSRAAISAATHARDLSRQSKPFMPNAGTLEYILGNGATVANGFSCANRPKSTMNGSLPTTMSVMIATLTTRASPITWTVWKANSVTADNVRATLRVNAYQNET